MSTYRATETLYETGGGRKPGPADVTVAISLYNYEEFIVPCLDSVRAQTLPELSLVIVDDGSKDDSREVAQAWLEANADRFARTALIKHVRNNGLAEARNTAFRWAGSGSVFVLDADNIIYPLAVERLQRAMALGDYGAAYSQIERFGDITALGWSDVWSREAFKRSNYVDAMALVSFEAWRRVGGYTHIEGGWEDYDFWCKFIDADIEALFVPEVLCRYRVHGQSMLRTETNKRANEVVTRMMVRHPWLELELME
jgi:glycosyltransferase involved in cell wall biosynthesis